MDYNSSTLSSMSSNRTFALSSGIFPLNSITRGFNSSATNTGSGNTPETDNVAAFESVVGIVVPVLFGSVGVLGFLGNFVVIATILFDRKRRNVTNILVLNLAFADLIFVVLCVPFTATSYVTTTWPFGSTWCKMHQYLIHVTAHASVYTLVLMSVDRYLAVVHPIGSILIRTHRHALLAIVGTWMTLGVCNSPMFQVFDVLVYQVNGHFRSICINVRLMTDLSHGRVFYGTFFLFAFSLPLLIVSLLYGILLSNLRTNARWRNQSNTGSSRTKRRVTRMVVVVVAVFAICWLPLQVVFLLQFVIGCHQLSASVAFVLVKIASTCLAYTNSAINPILYGFLSDNFRQSFRRLRRLILECVSCRRAVLVVNDEPGKTDARCRKQKSETAMRNNLEQQQSVALVLSSSALVIMREDGT